MSSGDLDDKPGSYAKLLELFGKHPELIRDINSEKQFDNTHDIPFCCGYSQDGKTIYWDRHIPLVWRLKRTQGGFIRVRVVPFGWEHEVVESAIVHLLGWTYEPAHHLATAAEYHALTRAGYDVTFYRKQWAPFIKTIASERIKRVPRDLDYPIKTRLCIAI